MRTSESKANTTKLLKIDEQLLLKITSGRGRDREHRLLARVTRKSWQRLNLQVGDHVFAQLKSMAMLGSAYDAGDDRDPSSGGPAALVQDADFDLDFLR